MNALVFGEILWDIIEGKPHLGGAPLNFAAHVKQCGHQSTIISALGNDERGEKAHKIVKELGVNTKLIQKSEKATGYVPVEIVNGQPDYEIVSNVAYDYVSAVGFDLIELQNFDLFYFGSLIQRNSVSRDSLYTLLQQHQFKHVFYDVNLRKDCYSEKIIQDSLNYCTILKLNDEEISIISKILFGITQSLETFCQAISRNHEKIETIIITAGGDGAYVYFKGELINVPTDPIEVVDTVGAGDAFSAAFASVYLSTYDPLKATRIANYVGGFVASSAGPTPKYSESLRAMFD